MKKLYLLLISLFVAIAANAVDYYLIGGFNNWSLKQASCKFTAKGDGTYELNYNGTLTSGFKINDGTWNNDAANFGGSGNLTPGVVYNLTVGGSSGNIGLAENIENPKLTFNPTAKTLLIEGQTVEAEYSYSIHGSMFTGSWQTKSLTEKDGKWVLENAVSVGGDFGIRKDDKSSGSQVDWISSAGAAKVELNTPMAAKVEGTNWTIGAGTFTYTFDPEAMTLTVTGEGGDVPTPDTFYWSGDLNGGTWVFNNALEGADGIYTATVDVTAAAGYLTITTGEMTDWVISNGVRYGAGDQDVNVVSGTAYEMKTGSDKCWILSKGKYTMTVDAANLKVTFAKEGGDEPLPTTIYWSGDVTGGWEFNNAIEAVDGAYVAAIEVPAVKGYITLTTGIMEDWAVADGVRYGAGTEVEIVSGTEYGMVAGNDQCWVLARGKYSMTVDMANLKVKFEKTGEIEDPIDPTDLTLYVVGSFSDWDFENAIEMEKAGNVYTANLGLINDEVEFKVSTDDWKTNFGAGEDAIITEGTELDAWFNSSYNFVLTPTEGAMDNVTVTFTLVEGSNIAGSATPSKIKVSWTLTGVEAIAAEANAEATYYNMQGVKVANPTNGLYIKVAGNKATKVVL